MKFIVRLKGGSGSGNFGHRGRSGEVGGSASSNTISGVNDAKFAEIGNSFGSAINKTLSSDLKLSIGRPRREGRWVTQTFTVEPKSGEGFAQALLWYNKTDQEVKVQQQDISLPENVRGKGIGGKMMAALVAGYREIGVGSIPIHLDTNPEFWDHMRDKYEGIFVEEE